MVKSYNVRLVFKTLGVLLMLESFFMDLPACVSLLYHETDHLAFFLPAALTCLVGLIFVLIGWKAPSRVGAREGYFIVAIVWIVFSLFGMLPYYLSGAVPTITNAFFETMSGFTTTGATNIANVEALSHGVLFWRSLTQWLGGMGIIVLSVAILPLFGLGGMQLYAAEVPGLSYDKIAPRISSTAKMMWAIYVLLTALEILLLWLEGMDIFDASCHSLSTIATGGFSTKNNSFAFYDSAAIHYTVTFFMLVSGINFTLLYYVLIGKPRYLFQNEEVRWYLSAVVFFTAMLFLGLYVTRPNWDWTELERAFRDGLFTVVSAMTSTGYVTSDYVQWNPALWAIVFFLMFTGACAGSTSGGIKWVRLGILVKNARVEFRRRIHPNAVIPVRFGGKPVTQTTLNNLMAFMFFYIVIIAVTSLIFCACGIPFDESIGTAVSAMGNVGISIGQFGPMGSYENFPVVGKWVMTFVMLIGRLEIFTVLFLFSPSLWKK